MEYKEIKQLVDDMGNSKIDELKIEFPDGTKISMKKNVDKIPNSLCVNENMASLNNCSMKIICKIIINAYKTLRK